MVFGVEFVSYEVRIIIGLVIFDIFLVIKRGFKVIFWEGCWLKFIVWGVLLSFWDFGFVEDKEMNLGFSFSCKNRYFVLDNK